jgi:hypothetical protein
MLPIVFPTAFADLFYCGRPDELAVGGTRSFVIRIGKITSE